MLDTRPLMTIKRDTMQRLLLDFASDELVSGRRFSIFCVVADNSRECLVEMAKNSLSDG